MPEIKNRLIDGSITVSEQEIWSRSTIKISSASPAPTKALAATSTGNQESINRWIDHSQQSQARNMVAVNKDNNQNFFCFTNASKGTSTSTGNQELNNRWINQGQRARNMFAVNKDNDQNFFCFTNASKSTSMSTGNQESINQSITVRQRARNMFVVNKDCGSEATTLSNKIAALVCVVRESIESKEIFFCMSFFAAWNGLMMDCNLPVGGWRRVTWLFLLSRDVVVQ